MKIFIEKNGCSRRKLDVSKFDRYFQTNGYEVVTSPDDADYIIITTCAFKKEEEDRSLSLVEKLSKYRAKTLVYGCLPEISPTRFSAYSKLDCLSPKNINDIDKYFVDIKYKFADVKDTNLIPDNLNTTPLKTAVTKFINEFELSSQFIKRSIRYAENKLNPARKDYYLSICRGCLGHCSYCAVRFAVGTVKSKPISHVASEFHEGLRAGHKEFIILGDDVGAYGQDINRKFPDLLSSLFEESDLWWATASTNSGATNEIRFHIEEFNPWWLILFKSEMVRLLASGRVSSLICPIQSCNDRILGLMSRKHDAMNVFSVLSEIKAANPRLQLTTQIIAGFPTETDDEFAETLERLGESPCDSVIIFPYDDKEVTESAGLFPKVSAEVIGRRVKAAQKHLKAKGINAYLSCQ